MSQIFSNIDYDVHEEFDDHQERYLKSKISCTNFEIFSATGSEKSKIEYLDLSKNNFGVSIAYYIFNLYAGLPIGTFNKKLKTIDLSCNPIFPSNYTIKFTVGNMNISSTLWFYDGIYHEEIPMALIEKEILKEVISFLKKHNQLKLILKNTGLDDFITYLNGDNIPDYIKTDIYPYLSKIEELRNAGCLVY